MTTYPTNAEIAAVGRTFELVHIGNGLVDSSLLSALCAAARDRNRLEAENAKLREAYREEVILTFMEPAANYRAPAYYLCEGCNQRWLPGMPEHHAQGCLARPSQLETDNG